jgi:hypothetical protein
MAIGDMNPQIMGVSVSTETRDRASNVARAFYRIISSEITIYNDTPGRTKREMMNALTVVRARLNEDPSRA